MDKLDRSWYSWSKLGPEMKRQMRWYRKRKRKWRCKQCRCIQDQLRYYQKSLANFKLCRAAAKGNLKKVKELTETYEFDRQYKTPQGITALHCASYCGQLEVIKYLINQKRYDPSAEDHDGECPLAYSAKHTVEMDKTTMKSPLNDYWPKSYNQNFHTAMYLIRSKLAQTSAQIFSKIKPLYVLRLPLFTDDNISLSDLSEFIKLMVIIFGQDNANELVCKEVYACFKLACKDPNWHKFDFATLLLRTYPIYIKKSLTSDPEQFAKMTVSLQNAIEVRHLSLIKLLFETDICKPNLISFKKAIKQNDYDMVCCFIQSPEICSLSQQLVSYTLDLTQYLKRTRCSHCGGDYPNLSLITLILVKCISCADCLIKDAEGNNPLHLACNRVHSKDLISCINEANSSYQLLPNNDGKLPLHVACMIDHEAIQFVSSHPEIDFNTQDKAGCTPLHTFCKSLSIRITTIDSVLDCFKYFILQKKCNIYIKNNEGKLPLHILLESSYMNEDHKHILLKFCSDSANINVQDDYGNTPLHIACRRNNLTAVLYFASNPCCNKNLPNVNGLLPIHCAISSHMPLEAVKAVNEGCMWISNESNSGITPLHIALRNEKMNVVAYLVESMATDCSNVRHLSKIYEDLNITSLCINERDIELLKLLINEQNINQADDKGNTPIHVACQHKNIIAAKFLTELVNSDLSRQDNKGRLPLHIACSISLEFVKLTSNGCDVNLCDNTGSTPLHIACQAGFLDIVQYLVEIYVCEPSKIKLDNHKMLPVDYACKYSLELVKLVSISGNSVTYHDSVKTLSMACFYGSLDIVQYLINKKGYHHLGDNHSPLLYACGLRNEYYYDSHSNQALNIHADVVEFLISKCCYDPLEVDLHQHSNFVSLFQYACRYDNLSLIKALTINSIDLQDHKGNTSLHYACKYECPEIVHYLVNSNCDQTIANKKKKIALHLASKVSLKVIQLLTTEHDAIINSQDDAGDTPLHIACAHKCDDIIQYLLKQKSCRADIFNKDGNLALHQLVNPRNYDYYLIEYDYNCTSLKPQIIQLVLKRNVKAAATYNNNKLSPIIIAILREDIDFFEVLYKSEYDFPKKNVLQLACLYRKPKIVHWLIKHGTRHTIKNSSGNLPQHLCFMGKRSCCLQTLMQLGSLDICSQNQDSNTVVHMACMFGKIKFLRKLLKHPNVHHTFSIQNSNKETPLHLALSAENTSFELIKLVATLDNVNIQNIGGDTPLHIACCHYYSNDYNNMWVRIIDLLICELKGSVEVLNNKCNTPFHILLPKTLHRSTRNFIYKIPKHIISLRNINNETILHLACTNRQNFAMIISYLIHSIKYSADTVNKLTSSGAMALHLACIAGDLNTVQLLVDCDPLAQITDTALLQNGKCISGDTALHVACRSGDPKIVEYLLKTKHQEALTALNVCNELPFHLACHNEKMVDMFVKFRNKFNCNSQTSSGNTFLHIACQQYTPHRTVITILLRKFKCNARIPNYCKDLPLHIACKDADVSLDVIKMLGAALSTQNQMGFQNCDGNTPLHLLLLSHSSYFNDNNILHKVKFLINQIPSLAHISNNNGKQPIHLACRHNQISIVKCLHKLSESLEFPPRLLHESCHNEHPDVFKFMMMSIMYHGHDINLPDTNGDIPLHLAIRQKKSKEYIRDLMKLTKNINQKNHDGITALHEACANIIIPRRQMSYDSLDFFDPFFSDYDYEYDDDYYDIDSMCSKCQRFYLGYSNSDSEELESSNRLRDDSSSSSSEGIKNDDHPCESTKVNSSNKEIKNDEHFTEERDDLYILKELLKIQTINVSIQNSSGQTPLHCLSGQRLYEGLRLLVNHETFKVNVQDQKGLTLLHIACESNCHLAVDLLLSSAAADPSLKDNLGRSPIVLTDDSQITKLLIDKGADPEPLYDMHRRFFNEFSSAKPPQTPVKLLVIGHPSVGKTTLIQSLQNEMSDRNMFRALDRTAGIELTNFKSSIYGDVTFYDFAGQPEYYASHDAIIHSTVKNIPPIVLILVDLTKQMNIILSQIHYWTNFIENRCAKLSDKAHLIIVCSHADVIVSQEMESTEIISQLQSEIKSRKFLENKNMILKDVIKIDCTTSHSSEMKQLQRALRQSTSELRKEGTMNFRSHVFLTFLYQIFKHKNYITLRHIFRIIDKEMNSEEFNDGPLCLIPSESQKIVELCRDLHDKGHIYFIEDPNDTNSLLVLDKEPLLHDLLGSLFAPCNFPQHCPLSYSTGIIPLSSFERYCLEILKINCPAYMLLEFLSRLEYCREVTDKIVIESLVKEEGYSNIMERDSYYFFPSLVSLDRPVDKWSTNSVSYKCGWLIQCSRGGEFFSPHFIQAILLRLVFSFTTQKENYDSKDREIFYGESDVHCNQILNMVIKRKCSVWKNGIYWQEASGVKTIIDIIDQRTLILLMSCQCGSEASLLERRSTIIFMILNAKKEFCPNAMLLEYFIHPEIIVHPLLDIDNSHLFALTCIVRSIKNEERYVLNEHDQAIELDKLLYFEPYTEIDADMVKYLCSENTLQQQISDMSLQLLAKQLCHRLSIFKYLCSISHSQRREALQMQTQKAMYLSSDDVTLSNKLFQILKQKLKDGIFQDLRNLLDRISIFRRRPLPIARIHPCAMEGGRLISRHRMNIINGTIYDLLVREYASQWRDIGAALGFSQGEMNTIQANPLLMLQTPPKSWLRELLTQWMQWEPGDQRGSTAIPTREALRAALLKANLGNVAEMIKDA